MDKILTVVNWLLPLVYLALVVDYGATFFLRVRSHARNPWILGAVVFHAAFVVLRGVRLGYPPLVGSYEVLSIVALSATIVYWVMELASRDRRAGVFVFLLIFLCQYTSSIFLAHDIADPSCVVGGPHGWGRVHVIPATFAYTAMAFAAVYGLLHLMGLSNLKHHRFGLLFDRMPPLELLGKLSWLALLGGFLFISASIVTGIVLFREAQNAQAIQALGSKVEAKIIAGSAAWLVCAVAVFGKIVGKWSPARVSFVAVTGFLAVLALLLSSIVLS